MKMGILADEARVLKAYTSGDYINNQTNDAILIDRLSTIGLMSRGLDVETMQETAIITTMGRQILESLR
ncbi:MAG: hypothetical protein WC626_09465 [Methanoregula sp.]